MVVMSPSRIRYAINRLPESSAHAGNDDRVVACQGGRFLVDVGRQFSPRGSSPAFIYLRSATAGSRRRNPRHTVIWPEEDASHRRGSHERVALLPLQFQSIR